MQDSCVEVEVEVEVPPANGEGLTAAQAGLLESQKEKHRAIVAGIPTILSHCGYAVIPVAE